MKRPHGKVVRTAVMESKLFFESHLKTRSNGRNRSVSYLHGDFVPLYRCGGVCMGE